MRICPLPDAWERTHRKLVVVRDLQQSAGNELPPVPIPLVLAGWTYSNDLEKRRRWEEMKEWALNAGAWRFIDEVGEGEWYEVSTPSTYTLGPMGGPMYRSWESTPSKKVSPSQKGQWISLLSSKWNEIAGPSLSETTRPLRITGAKGKRLVVLVVEPSATPPWGDWDRLPMDERRISFREFRTRVNNALEPHVVDHVDFVRSE